MPDRETKRSAFSRSVLEQGKIPPQAVDMEEVVLGAMMLEPPALINGMDLLKADYFYKDQHRIIFEAIALLFAESKAVDILTVNNRLMELGTLEEAGGAYYIAQLTNRVSSGLHLEDHAEIIETKFKSRQLIGISSEAIRDAFDDTVPVRELYNNIITAMLQEITDSSKGATSIQSISEENLEKTRKLKESKQDFTGIKTNFTMLDGILLGLQPGNLYILAGRPGMGKTAMVISLIKNIAIDDQVPIAMFSLEMSESELEYRLKSNCTGIKFNKIRSGKIDDAQFHELTEATDLIKEAPIFVDDSSSLNIIELRARALRLKQIHNIKVLFVDYIQLMNGAVKNRNREQEISEISRNLKIVAKDLEIPVIALSQLSRKVEDRGGNKRPELYDLRESGSLEQDADAVLFLYRQEYYHITTGDNGETLPDGHTEFMIKKHRNGATGTVLMKFRKEPMKFVNYDEDTEAVAEAMDDGDQLFPEKTDDVPY